MAEQTEPKDQTPTTKPESNKPAPQDAAKKAKNNKNLIIIGGILVFVLFILPMLFFFIVFGVVKNKVNDVATEKTVTGLIEGATGGQVKVDANGKEITVKGKDGTEFSSSQKLPTDWPSSVPIYSPYTITGSFKASDNGKTGWNLATETSDSYDKAKTGLASLYSGWTKQSEYESNGTTLTAYENTTYNVMVSISQPDSSTKKVTINYTVTQK